MVCYCWCSPHPACFFFLTFHFYWAWRDLMAQRNCWPKFRNLTPLKENPQEMARFVIKHFHLILSNSLVVSPNPPPRIHSVTDHIWTASPPGYTHQISSSSSWSVAQQWFPWTYSKTDTPKVKKNLSSNAWIQLWLFDTVVTLKPWLPQQDFHHRWRLMK